MSEQKDKVKIKILFLEDEQLTVESVKASASVYCEKKPYEFDIKNVASIKDALSEIYVVQYDSILIDLHLSDDEPDGNTLVSKIVGHLRIPSFIYSGTMNKLTLSENGYLFRHYRKSDDIEKLFNHIIEIFESGYNKVFGVNGLLDELINKVYWNHLSKNLILKTYKKTDKLNRLLRYSLTLASELSSLDDNQKSDQFESDEVYIIPAIKQFYTGNIVTNDGEDFIIVTPACDMERLVNNSDDFITLCKINYEKYRLFIEKHKGKLSENRVKEISKELSKESNDYFVLPKSNSVEGSYIEFKNVRTVIFKDLVSNYRIKHSISTLYMRNIQARFGIIFSRQGNPEINAENLEKIMFTQKED